MKGPHRRTCRAARTARWYPDSRQGMTLAVWDQTLRNGDRNAVIPVSCGIFYLQSFRLSG